MEQTHENMRRKSRIKKKKEMPSNWEHDIFFNVSRCRKGRRRRHRIQMHSSFVSCASNLIFKRNCFQYALRTLASSLCVRSVEFEWSRKAFKIDWIICAANKSCPTTETLSTLDTGSHLCAPFFIGSQAREKKKCFAPNMEHLHYV